VKGRCRMAQEKFTVRNFLQSVRDGKFTSYGCYPKFWATSDGAALCYDCCKAECGQIARAIRDGETWSGWHVFGVDANWEDPSLFCDHCSGRIESAYAEDDATG
jgi:hypothetical protein